MFPFASLNRNPFRFLITPASVNSDLYYDLALAPAAFWGHVRSDGGDIRVVKQDGLTPVPREVVGFDATAHTGSLFIGTSSGTAFYVAYGNRSWVEPAANATYGKYNVWESAAKAVFHLHADGADSTVGQHNDTSATPPAYGGAGKLGNCGDFGTGAIADDKHITTGVIAHGIGAGDFAMVAWVYPTAYYTALLSHTNVCIMSNGTYAPCMFANGTSGTGHALGMYADGFLDFGTDVALNAWSHIAVSRRTNVIYGYVNGAPAAVPVTNAVYLNDVALWLGRNVGDIDQFAGKIDEARLYSRGPLDAEIATMYANQNAPGTFWTTGAEQQA